MASMINSRFAYVLVPAKDGMLTRICLRSSFAANINSCKHSWYCYNLFMILVCYPFPVSRCSSAFHLYFPHESLITTWTVCCRVGGVVVLVGSFMRSWIGSLGLFMILGSTPMGSSDVWTVQTCWTLILWYLISSDQVIFLYRVISWIWYGFKPRHWLSLNFCSSSSHNTISIVAHLVALTIFLSPFYR